MADTIQLSPNAFIATPAGPSIMDGLNPNALTSEGLMMYLSDRLNGLDNQISVAFDRQKKLSMIHEHLNNIKAKLSAMGKDSGNKGDAVNAVQYEIDQIKKIDPGLGEKLQNDLSGEGMLLTGEKNWVEADHVKATEKYLDGLTSQLESNAQLDMIGLQATMSKRQSAIQIATNLISALGRSTDAIAANIGK